MSTTDDDGDCGTAAGTAPDLIDWEPDAEVRVLARQFLQVETETDPEAQYYALKAAYKAIRPESVFAKDTVRRTKDDADDGGNDADDEADTEFESFADDPIYFMSPPLETCERRIPQLSDYIEKAQKMNQGETRLCNKVVDITDLCTVCELADMVLCIGWGYISDSERQEFVSSVQMFRSLMDTLRYTKVGLRMCPEDDWYIFKNVVDLLNSVPKCDDSEDPPP